MRRLIRQRPDINGITEGVIWKQLLLFFFPIVLGTFFQQLYNTADAIIVGKVVGKEALAQAGAMPLPQFGFRGGWGVLREGRIPAGREKAFSFRAHGRLRRQVSGKAHRR